MPQAAWMGRQAWLAALAGVIGIVAGAVSGVSRTTAAIVLPLALLLICGLCWYGGVRRQRAVARLRRQVAPPGAEAPSADDDYSPLDELEPLGDDLRALQSRQELVHRQQEQQLASLRRDSALAQTVLGTMVEGVAVLDQEARFLYVNRAARRLLELAGRDVTGRLLHELVRAPLLQEVVARALASGKEHHLELTLTRRERTVEVSAGSLPLDPAPGVVLVLHDVTELRRLEQVRRDFASNVSHELKTPLTSIQAYADALLDGGLEDPQVNRNFLERIVQQSERLEQLIYDLLNLSRIESEEDLLELEPVDLAALAAEVLPAHASVAQGHGLALTTDLAAQPVTILGDREGLQTIFNNLIRNALTYTPAGGSVSVRVRPEEPFALLEVQDTGVGIAREHQQRIFERFFRVDKARSREVGGTGLGLSIVKHLAELFGGTIEVDSEVGRGSLFRVRWPLHASRDPSQPPNMEEDAERSQTFIESS